MTLSKYPFRSNESPRWGIILLCGVLQLLSIFSSAISAVPSLRLFESTLCRAYYARVDPSVITPDGTVPENICKIDEIQSQLAFLNGWKSFFDLVPGLLLGIPYSSLSERIDRRLLLLANVSSRILSKLYVIVICYFYNSFNVRLVWLSSLFDCVGGGGIVFDTLIQSMIAENAPEASLTKILFYLAATLSISRMIGVTTGSFMLKWSIYIPLLLSLIVLAVSPIAIFFLTGHTVQKANTPAVQEYRLLQSSNSHELHAPEIGENGDETEEAVLGQEMKEQRQSYSPTRLYPLIKSFSVYITHAYNHSLILLIFFVHEIAMGIRDITQQWLSKRYSLPLRIAGYILASETLLASMILLLLPQLLKRVGKLRNLSPTTQDLVLSCGSLLAAAIGTSAIAFSGSVRWIFFLALGVYALGVGFADAQKSLVTKLVGENEFTMLYLCISYVQTLANAFNGPLWAEIYSFGLGLGEIGMAAPFLVSSLLIFGTLGLVLILRRRNWSLPLRMNHN